MPRKQSLEKLGHLSTDDDDFPFGVEIEGPNAEGVTLRPPASYRQALGNDPIRVGIVEFRIMLFLASWPYHAFTRREIADAINTACGSVSEASVDDHIATLRDQLGIFHDFVQTVPHVGYRFKA